MGSGASTRKNREDKNEEERKTLLKQRKVTCDILEKLARALPKTTNPLGKSLHLPNDNTQTLEWEANMHYLQTWKLWKRDEATIGTLIDLLKKAGHKDDVWECLFNISKEPKNACTVTENREEVILPAPSRIGTCSHVYRGSLEGSSRSFLSHDLLPDHKINTNHNAMAIAEQHNPEHPVPNQPQQNHQPSLSNGHPSFSGNAGQPSSFFNALQESIHGNQQEQNETFQSLRSTNHGTQNSFVQNHIYTNQNHQWTDFRDMQNVVLSMQYSVGIDKHDDYFPGITTTKQGDIFVSNHKKNMVCKIDTRGQCSTLLQCRDMTPAGLCCTKDNMIAVCTRQGVALIDANGYTRGGFGKEELVWPRGICIDQHERFIVSDTQRNTVTIFSSTGQPVTALRTPNDLKLKQPYYVATNDHNQIVVSDSNNNCIKIFDQNGTYLRKFGNYGTKKQQLNRPLGVVTDCCGNMIVADFGNNRLSLFSSGGWFLKHVLTKSTHGIERPTALALYNHHEILLTCAGSSTINRYSLHTVTNN